MIVRNSTDGEDKNWEEKARSLLLTCDNGAVRSGAAHFRNNN